MSKLSQHLAAAAVGIVATFGAACSSAVPQVTTITQGAWAGEAGPDVFLFELEGSPPDSLTGAVHVMRGGRMDSQLAITRATYRAPDLEMYIASTNATYRGRVDTTRGIIKGALSFGEGAGPEMELHWLDPTGLPGYVARSEGPAYEYTQPPQGVDGWETAPPEQVGLDQGALEQLVTGIARGDAGLIHSVQVVRAGKLVLDEYFHGYGPEDLHRLASTTKSVSSLLVGVAIDRGLIPGVEAPLLPLLGDPTSGSGPWSQETLETLLTMSMGLDWSPQEANDAHGTGPDFFSDVLARRVVAEPGSRWEYVSANVNLLADVIHRATGSHADEFAAEALFSPLGITTYNWDYGKQAGYVLMDGSLQLRPRDLAKIGAMVAAGGVWDGHQVISEGWIRQSTATRLRTGQRPVLGGYGYLWWTGELPTADGTRRLVVANGQGSQFIVIVPELDLVVVTTGGNDDNGRHLDIGRVLSTTLLASL